MRINSAPTLHIFLPQTYIHLWVSQLQITKASNEYSGDRNMKLMTMILSLNVLWLIAGYVL